MIYSTKGTLLNNFLGSAQENLFFKIVDFNTFSITRTQHFD